jgi:hypothetical protein
LEKKGEGGEREEGWKGGGKGALPSYVYIYN